MYLMSLNIINYLFSSMQSELDNNSIIDIKTLKLKTNELSKQIVKNTLQIQNPKIYQIEVNKKSKGNLLNNIELNNINEKKNNNMKLFEELLEKRKKDEYEIKLFNYLKKNLNLVKDDIKLLNYLKKLLNNINKNEIWKEDVILRIINEIKLYQKDKELKYIMQKQRLRRSLKYYNRLEKLDDIEEKSSVSSSECFSSNSLENNIIYSDSLENNNNSYKKRIKRNF